MVKTSTTLTLLLVLLSACAQQPVGGLDQTGSAAPARLEYAPPGTVITLLDSDNGATSESRITVAPPTGYRGTYTTDNGNTGSFYPGCWACGGDNLIETGKYAQLWPLETGKNVAFLRDSPDGLKARVVIRVIGTETIETAAGRFDTYVLDGRVEHLTGPRHSAQVRVWWARDPGWVVQVEGSDSDGNVLTSKVTSIQLP